jgi:hypothetical protein
VLLLECVKELEDAFTLMEVLQEHHLPLLQVRGHRHNSYPGCSQSGRCCQPLALVLS